MKRIAFIAFLLLAQFNVAQNDSILDINVGHDRVVIEMGDGIYEISFLQPEVVQISFKDGVEQGLDQSHAIRSQARVPLRVMDLEEKYRINIGQIHIESLKVHVMKSPFEILVYQGGELLMSHSGFSYQNEHYRNTIKITSDEKLFGGGARALGMNRRGHKLDLYNRAHYGYETEAQLMNFCIPMYVSSKRYAVHFDDPGIGSLDLDSDSTNTITYESINDRRTFQVITGDTWKKLLQNWTFISGRQPLPPIWAFGNFASRFGYHSQEEAQNVVDQFRSDSIPLDAIILDLYWFGKTIKGTMGNLAFDRDSFPQPSEMIKGFHDRNVKTVLVTEPFVLTTSNRWGEAVEAKILTTDSLGDPFKYDFYFGNTGLIDIFKMEGKKWFWGIYKDLIELGVAGFWGDLGEPEVHPAELQHATASADYVHNIYGHEWAKLLRDGYMREYENERPFILMRSGYSGSQRYGMIPWSGDVNRSWGGLRSQPELSLHMGLQGVAYMHSDLGGFAGTYEDDELYTRWLQYGVFQPIFRPHAQEELASEPIFKADSTKAIAKQAIELRYQLLPYNYTMAWQNSERGTPLMRPLFWEETDNEALFENDSSYMWGDDFLIAPVFTKAQKSKEVYFPKGANWIDFYTQEVIEGGRTKEVELNEAYIPTYLREGAFIPLVSTIQSTEDYDPKEVVVHYFVGNHGNDEADLGEFYYDNGQIDGKEPENHELISFLADRGNSSGAIQIKSKTGKSESIQLAFVCAKRKLKSIQVNGKKVKITSDVPIDIPFVNGEASIFYKLK